MAGGGEASVRVPINLEIVNSSLADIKKVLDSLSPNTKNFEALKTIVADMEKSAAAFAQKMAVPFKSKSQFTSAGKDLDKFMAQMEKFNKLRGGLELGDFKVIDPASLQQIENLKKQLEDAQKEIVKIQEQTLQGLFNNADVSGALVKIDPEITKKSFEEVEEIVNEKVDEINEKIAKIGSENNKAIDIGNKLKEIVGKDFISSDVLGEDVFNQFFKKNGSFKAGQQNPFVEYLTETFNLTPDQVSKLKDQSASKINEILNETFKNGNRKFFRSQTMQAAAAEKGSADLVNDQQILAALQQVQNAFNTAGQQSEQYRQALVNLKNAMDGVTQSGQKQGQVALGTNYDAMAQAVQSYKASLESAQGSLMKLNRQQAAFNSLKSAITNFMGFTQVLNLVKKGVSDAASHIKELDTVMNGISIVTNMSTADLWGQVDAYTQLAQKYGTTIKGAYEVSQIYYQQGLKSNEVMSLTEETLKLSKISGLDYATTTDYMTTALRGFHMEMEEASRVVDVYSALAANTAVSQQELAEAMTRTASSMEAIGTTFEEASAMIATMVAATRESASNIGSAMKSIGSRYGELTKDPTKLIDSEGEEISFNKVDAALKSVGISMQTADHQFRSFTEVILELSDAWDTLDSRQQRYIATQMAGNRQQSRFLALVSNGDELRRNLEIAENSEGTGIIQVSKSLEGLEAKINQVQTAWQEFYTTIGLENAWKVFLEGATQVLNTLNGLPKLFDKIPVLAINSIFNIVNAIKTVGLGALSGIAKQIIPIVSAAGDAAVQEMGKKGELAGIAFRDKLRLAMQAIKSDPKGSLKSIFTGAGSGIAMIGGAISSLSLMMDQSTQKAKQLAGIFSGAGAIVQAGGGIAQLLVPGQRLMGLMNILSGIMGLISARSIWIEDAEERAERLQKVAEETNLKLQQAKSDERSLDTIIKRYKTLEQHRFDSEEAAQEYQDYVNEIVDKFPEVITGFKSTGEAITNLKTLEDTLAYAREATAAATKKATEAELERAQNALADKKEELKQSQSKLSGSTNELENYYKQNYESLVTVPSVNTAFYRLMGEQRYSDPAAQALVMLSNLASSNVIKKTNQKELSTFLTETSQSEAWYNSNIAQQFSALSYLAEGLSTDHGPTDQVLQIFKNFLKSKISEKETRYFQAETNIQTLNLDTASLEDLVDAQKELRESWNSLENSAKESYQANYEKYKSWIDEAIISIGEGENAVKKATNADFFAEVNKQTEQYSTLNSSPLYSVLTSGLKKHYDKLPNPPAIEDFISQFNNIFKNLNEWLEDNSNKKVAEDLFTRLQDTEHYLDADQILKNLNISDPVKDTIEYFIKFAYEDNISNIQSQVKEKINTSAEQGNDIADTALEQLSSEKVTSSIEQRFINAEQDAILELSRYNDNLTENNFDWGVLFDQFKLLDANYKDIIMSNGIGNIEDIQNSIDKLEVSGDIDAQNMANQLKTLMSFYINKMGLTIELTLEDYIKNADDSLKDIKKLQSGIGFEDTQKTIDSLNAVITDETQKLSLKDFDFADGVFTIKSDSWEKSVNGFKKKLTDQQTSINDYIEILNNFPDINELTEDTVKEIAKTGFDIEQYINNNNGQFSLKEGIKPQDFTTAVNTRIKELQQSAQSLTDYQAYYELQITQMALDYNRVDKNLSSIISNRKDIQLTDVTKLKNLLGFTDIQQMIDEGFIKWTGDHYEATTEQLKKMLNQSVTTGKLTDITQINNFQAQIDKLAQEASAENALADIIASPDKVTEEMLVAWANAWKVNVDIIKEQFIKNADGKTYSIKGSTSDFITRRGMDATEVAVEYANKLHEAISTVYNGVTSAITSGEQRLNNTAEIREIIVPLQKIGVAQLDEALNKWIITVTDENIQEVINAINASDLSQEQKTKNIDSILKAQQSKTFDTVFSSILKDTKNISRDTMQKLADFYGVSVEALLATDAFKFDANTQAYAVQDKSYLKSILATSKGKINETAYRSLEAQLYTMENEFNGQAMSFLSNTNIKETDIADILNKYQENTGKNLLKQFGTEIISFSDFINTYFTRDANGNLQIQDNEAFRDLAVQLGLSQEQIQNALIQRISNTISNLSSLSNDIINGFNTPDKMNAVLQELRRSYYKGTTEKGKIIDFDFSDIFEYNDALNKFVYTQTGIALRIRQLKQQLEQADGNKDAIDAQRQLDMFMAELGQSIDITGYLNFEQGTKEQQKARQELIRNVNNYNVAALEHTGQIAISQDELNEALSGNLTSIENIYKTINKDISSQDLLTIYQRPLNTVQTAIDAIANGDNTIVDSTTKEMLRLSGATKAAIEVAKGKWKLTFKTTGALGNAYITLYDTLDATNQASIQQLNELAAKIAKNQMSKQQAGIELLSNATEMTIDQFVDIFTSLGITVDKNFLAADKWGKYLTLLGGDNLQIKDLSGLIKEQGLEGAFSTEKGKEALKSYADSMIQQANSMHDRLMSLASELQDAEIGDQINVTGLGLENDTYLNNYIKDGVLTLRNKIVKNVLINKLLSTDGLGKYLTDIERETISHTRQYAASERAYAAAKTITDNWDNVSFEMLTEFAKANNYTMQSVLDTFIRNADGSYSSIGSKVDFAQYAGLDKKYIADLRREANDLVDTTISDVIEASIQHLQDGSEQKITVTDENRDILTQLDEMGWGKLENATNEFIINSISKNVDEVIAAIQATTGISQSQKNQWISQLYKDQQNKTSAAILSNAFNSADNLDYETVVQLTDKFGKNFTNFNRTTGIFSLDLPALSQYLENLDKLPNLLGARQEALKNAGLDNDSLRMARAQVASLIQSSSVYTRGNALISGRQNISETMISDFLDIADISANELMKYMTKEGDHWTMNDSQALAFAKRIGMTQKEIFETFATSTTSAIDNFGGNIVSGFSNISDMQNIVDTINSHMDLVGRLFAGTPTIDALFEYNESLGKFILSTDGIAAYVNILRKQLDQATDASQKEIVDGQIKQLQKQVKDAVNFDTIFDTGRSSKTRENDRKELIRQLANVNAADKEAGKTIQENIENLFVGGEAAVQAAANIYQALGKSFTVEDANKFAQMNLSQVDAAREALDSNVGDYITKEAAVLGEAAGYFVVSKPDSNGFVQILKKNKDNLENALRQYYHALLANGEQDIDKLNEAIINIWEEQGNKISGQNDLLSKASGMTFREFGEGLAAIGVTLTENMLQEYLDSGLIEQIAGTNQVKVTNFEQFARRIGVTDRTSKQYQDLYSQFIDSQIEDLTYAQESIISSVNDISDAKAGDKINISKAMAQFDQQTQLALEQYFSSYGAQYANGILAINKNTDVFGIADALLQATDNVTTAVNSEKIESAMVQLQDAIQDAIKGFVDAIASGIKGGITNSERSDLINFSDKYLGGILNNEDFVQASDGMKLTTDAAIKLYNALKNIEGVDISGVFDGLSESILSRDNIDTMDGILSKIEQLSEEIAKADQKGTAAAQAKVAALREELSLYQEIAVANTSNPDSYNFMDKKLPDGMQGPLNYWKSTEQMFQTMTASAKSGYMSVQDFYAIANEMEHLSKLSGKTMSFMGMQIGEGAMSAAEAIEAGMSNLSTTAGHAGEVNLKGLTNFGMNLSMSADQMAAGVEDGIHAAAQANIDMLDGLIAILETVVAMEGLSDITGEDNDIDLKDIFPELTYEGAEGKKGTQAISENYHNWAVELDKKIRESKDFEKKCEQIVLGNKNLKEIIQDSASGDMKIDLDAIGLTAGQFTEVMEAFRQLNAAGGFDSVDDMAAMMKTLSKTGAEITAYMGDQKVTLTKGKVLIATKNKKGEYEYTMPDGSKTTDVNKMLQAQIQADLQKDVEAINAGRDKDLIIQNKDKTYSVSIAGATYKLDVNEKGNYVFEGLDGKEYSTIDQAMPDLLASWMKKYGQGTTHGASGIAFSNMETWQLRLALGIDAVPTITNADQLTPEMLGRIVSKGYKNVDQLAGKELELGFSIKPKDLSSNQKKDIEAAIENFNKIPITPEVAPINADDIKVEGAIHVFAVIDGFVDSDNVINLRSGTGYTKVLPGQNLREALGKEQEEFENFYRQNPYVRKHYAPNGESYDGPAGRAVGKELWERSQKGEKLSDIETSAAEAYGKKFVEPIQNFLKSEDYKNSVSKADKQAEESREQWKKEHNSSEEGYNYQKASWFTEVFNDTQKGSNKTLAQQYQEALMASGDWDAWRTQIHKDATVNGKFDEEKYASIFASAVKAWQAQNEKDNQNAQLTAEDAASALVNAAAQQQLAGAVLNAAAQALLGASGDIGAALKQYGISEDQINKWVTSGALSKDFGQKLIEQLNKESASTTEEESQGNKDLLNENASLSTQNKNLQNQLAATAKEIEQLQSTINELTNINAASEKEKVALAEQLAAAKERANDLEARLADLTTENETLLNEKNKLNDQIQSLLTQLKEINTIYQSEQIRLSNKQYAEDQYKKAIEEHGLLSEQAINAYDFYQSFVQKNEESIPSPEVLDDQWNSIITSTTNEYDKLVSEILENPDETKLQQLDSLYLSLQGLINGYKDLTKEDYHEFDEAITPDEIRSILSEYTNDTLTQEKALDQQQQDKQNAFFEKYGTQLLENPASLYAQSDDKKQEFIKDYNDAFGQLTTSFDEAVDGASEQFNILSSAVSAVSGPTSEATSAFNSVSPAAKSATTAVNTVNTAFSNLKGKTVGVDVYVREHNSSPNISLESSVGATGNVALAAGTRTLMGELGPELVVSNGRYFVAGQNGAEFVDLDKDAIVFNHLQTQRLLANGSTGRGKAITNARNATSMATGNVTGPAKASASQALSQLRAIRAMWESLRDASLSDLAKKGGGGGGGGGNKQIPGFIRDVERWYNWLQKIADLEKQITYQEQLRSKIQSDMVSSGDAYYKSQRKTYQDARDSALTSESLFLSQKEYFNNRRQQLNNSPLSDLYTFDESGQLHFQEGSYEWLANLFKTDDYGNLSMSAKQQYQAIIKRNPNFAQYMKYDESGKQIKRKDFKSEDEYYVAMVKAFSDRMDAEKEEMQELFDSWNDQQKAVLEQMQAMNEQLQAMKDNQIEVEESVLKAIEEIRERQIKEMEDTRDALQETNEDFIDGLNDALDKERKMYQDNEKDQELQRNRRQLAILQRSGASASQIASMQQKIDQQAQDQYFEKQQEQIDAVREASDAQIERLDHQIELAQEQLEFEKANGLLWGEVYQVMSRSPEEIANFIKENTEDFWSKSPMATTEAMNDLVFKTEQWTEFRDDIDMQNAAMGRIDQNLDIFMGALEQIYGKQANWNQIKKESEAKYKEYWGIDDEDPNATAWDAYPGKNDEIAEHTTNTMGVDTSVTTTSSSSSGGRTGLENKWYTNSSEHWKRNWYNGSWSRADYGKHKNYAIVTNASADGTISYKCSKCGYVWKENHKNDLKNAGIGGASPKAAFAGGGKDDYTGLAMLHGTPSKPEGILNAEDYKAWKQDIKTTSLLYGALASVSATQRGAAAAVNSTTTNGGITIEHAEVSMNATIANDYDARRAGEQALEQMIAIARKSGTRSTQRR